MEQLGKFLGRYQLVRVLGRGAMGVVYEGVDPKLNRQVAVKTILKSQLIDVQLAEEYSARFIREAQAVARLNHANIVTVFDFGNEADVAYLVMEFIRGKELKNYLDDKHIFGIAEAVAIVCDLLEALDYAHNNGVIHRDIKPANVMLDDNGRVKLTDFGVARLIDGGGHEGTRAGTMVGTPSYMSPEQIKGLPVGAQADLFATGVLLYQCLSLQKPFIGNSEWEIWQKIVNEDPPALSTYRAAVPVALERAMLRALAKDPSNRPATARALILDLKAAIAGEEFDADATRLIGASSPQPGRAEAGSMARTGGGTQGDSSRQLQPNSEVELEFWRSIKDSADHEEFQLYLERFSNGTYADLARRKMSKLQALGGTQRTAQTDASAARRPQEEPAEQRKAAAGAQKQAQKIEAEAQKPARKPVRREAVGGNARSKTPLFVGAALIAALIGGVSMMRGTPPPAVSGQASAVPAVTAAPAGAVAVPRPDVAAQQAGEAVRSDLARAAQKDANAARADQQARDHASAIAAKKISDDARSRDGAGQKARDDAKAQELASAKAVAAQKARDDERIKALSEQKVSDDAKVQELVSAKAVAAQKARDETKALELVSAAAKASDEARAKSKARAEADPQALFEQAQRAEKEGRVREAVALYKQAYGAGNGRAARMLGDIYARGSGDVGRDYSEQVQWYGKAKAMGVEIPVLNKRNF
jgi:serine/threonine-protein kinase